jgi:hypothetical protein
MSHNLTSEMRNADCQCDGEAQCLVTRPDGSRWATCQRCYRTRLAWTPAPKRDWSVKSIEAVLIIMFLLLGFLITVLAIEQMTR